MKKYREKLKQKFHGLPHDEQLRKDNAAKRASVFSAFFDKFIDSKIHSTYKDVINSSPSQWNDYAYVLIGSDQVWNSSAWARPHNVLKYYYLFWAERNKRVNYAPSFGVSHLPTGDLRIHKKGLMGFDRLSCRETRGCEIIKELTGLDAELVLDPTLLLTADDWRRIARKPEREIPERYVFVYMLGDEQKTAIFTENVLKKAAGNFPIVYLNQNSLPSPEEFLWLIDHAEYVFTSSFHGTIFSINFGKNFMSTVPDFDKWFDAWGSRQASILTSLGLMSRMTSFTSPKLVDEPIDYEAVYAKLNAMREKSMQYLRECLK